MFASLWFLQKSLKASRRKHTLVLPSNPAPIVVLDMVTLPGGPSRAAAREALSQCIVRPPISLQKLLVEEDKDAADRRQSPRGQSLLHR